MKKTAAARSIRDLVASYNRINFPEYQREPNVWNRRAKQRLVDSIMREFDIASIYFYQNEDGTIDCIDGRQRLNALMAFLGENPKDEDNGFAFTQINDIFEDDERPFGALDGLSFANITDRDDALAREFRRQFYDYRVTVVELSRSSRPEEFNLQFTRLNLGVIINSGEKLHAMVGALRDVCFKEGGIGLHPFLETTKIPTRRYAREQVAAQILCQIFSLAADKDFTRTRHFDLQRFFKEHTTLSAQKKIWIAETRILLDLLAEAFADPSILRNRAVTVSTVLLAWRTGVKTPEDAERLAAFVGEFLRRLQWQVGKGLDVDDEYRYLIDFQRHLTQASVEKPAVSRRAEVLESEYARWLENGELLGDSAYTDRTGVDPSKASRGG